MRILLPLLFLSNFSFGQAPSIEWQKSLGGSLDESAIVRPTNDGGYIFAGYTESNDGDVGNNNGLYDAWIGKLDASGNAVWQRNYGGSDLDGVHNIIQTSDGGYIFVGSTESNDGDISGNHGWLDGWVVKLDAFGNIEWQRVLGDVETDRLMDVKQTTDGGYIVCGQLSVFNPYSMDAWVLKLDNMGNTVWETTYGLSGALEKEGFERIQQTENGGFIAFGKHYYPVLGSWNWWVVNLDASGNLIWEKSIGGSAHEVCQSIEQTNDGGFLVSGSTESNDFDVIGNHGGSDIWTVKLDALGNIEWQRALGGFGYEEGGDASQTNDGGYIVVGYTGSNNGDISQNFGGYDCWVVKLNQSGNIVWEKSFGGSGVDAGISIEQTSDGGYIIGGVSDSNDGDLTFNHGVNDVWIVKLGAESNLNELVSNGKELIKVVDLLGRETTPEPNKVLIYIYSDGTIERKIQIK